MSRNSNSQDNDQGGYLSMGIELRENGMLSDGIRPPLYSALISPFAERDWAYFTLAKYVSLALGIISVLALYWGTKKLFGWKTALLASFLLGVNTSVIQYSAFVLPESLLLLLFILAWVFMVRALREGTLINWLLAGLFTGLAYLTKGTGQLLVIVFVLSAVIIKGLGIFKRKHLWLFLAVYCAVALPLWTYNQQHFGSPTFNYATTYQMWLDNWRDWYNLEREELPTFSSYIRTHSLSDMVQREWKGIKDLRFVFAKAIYPRRSLEFDKFLLSPWSTVLLGVLLVLPLAFFRRTRSYVQRHQPEIVTTSCLLAIFYLLFAWYTQIVLSAIRFLAPEVPMVLVFLSDIVMEVVSAVFRKINSRPLHLVVAGVLSVSLLLSFEWVWSTVWERHDALAQNIFQLDAQYNSFSDRPLTWLRETTQAGTVIAQGNVKSLPTWRHEDWFTFADLPDEMSAADLQRFFEASQARYIIVENNLLRFHQKADLGKHFAKGEGDTVQIKRFPPDWGLMLSYPDSPGRWYIFRLLKQQPVERAVDYSLGQHISLVGYDMLNQSARPGGTLTILLHWYFAQPPTENLTVFTHLVGPDGQMHGQQDNLPLGGVIHTSQLPPASRLVDRYDLAVSENAPPGTYQVMVGMYNPSTGQRVAVYKDQKALPDNAAPLTTVEVHR